MTGALSRRYNALILAEVFGWVWSAREKHWTERPFCRVLTENGPIRGGFSASRLAWSCTACARQGRRVKSKTAEKNTFHFGAFDHTAALNKKYQQFAKQIQRLSNRSILIFVLGS